MKGVIYARYSSDNQREESIEGQLRECKEYAERNDITILGTYIDRALSAKTDNRPEFQHMIKESAKGLFDVVLVWKLDRFARNRYDSARYKNLLKKNGVKVISARENISEGSEGIILEAMLEGYAEYYSVNLARNIKRGLKENALHAQVIGRPCLGYKAGENKQYEIEPIGAKTVHEIFDLYASGLPVSKIIKRLNAKGYTTVNGTAFTNNSLYNILRNRKYTGTYIYDDVVIEDAIPPIVTKEVFDKVQEMLHHNSKCRARAKAKEEYLLTTKLFCGKCGSPMIGDSGTSHTGATHRYYKCNHRKRQRVCDMGAVRKDPIEELVVKTTVERVLTPENIDRIAQSAVEIAAKEAAESEVLAALKQKHKEVSKRIANLMEAIERGIITSTTKERLEVLEQEQRDLDLQIIKEEMERPTLTVERVKYWL